MLIREVINSQKRQNNYIESSTIGGIVCPLIKIFGYRVFVYGCGRDIDSFINFFENNGISIFNIIDADEKKDGKFINEVECICFDRLKNVSIDTEKDYIIVTTDGSGNYEKNFIYRTLYELGFKNIYSLDGYDKRIMVGNDWNGELYCGRIRYLRENIERYEKLYSDLADDTSKTILAEYIRVHIECGIYSLKQIDGRYKYFYGLTDKIGQKEDIYIHLKDEVYVNCGADIGDNIFNYYAMGLTAKSVYAFEGNESHFKRLKYNISMLPDEIRNQVFLHNVYIDGRLDFGKTVNEKVTLVSADLEGSEIQLLSCIKNVIKKDHPVLAICVYHKIEDIVNIYDYIKSITNKYFYVLRKYASSNFGDARQITELVMYCIPEERMCK